MAGQTPQLEPSQANALTAGRTAVAPTGDWSARALALAAAVLFSTGGAGIKAEAFTGFQVSALRSGVAALTLLLWVRGRVERSASVAVVGLVYAATLTLFVLSTKLTTAANAIFLQSTAPLYLLLFGPWLLAERVHRRDVVYLAAVAAGMVLCFAGRSSPTATAPDPITGNLLALLCGIAWALTLAALRFVARGDRMPDAAMSAVIAGNTFACIGALPFAVPLPAAPAVAWITVLYLGVFQIGLAYVCLTSAVRHLAALEISLLLLIEPALNPVWTWLVRGETPGGWTIGGGAAILSATALKSLHEARVAPIAGHDGHDRR